jgi:hypothetical protein
MKTPVELILATALCWLVGCGSPADTLADRPGHSDIADQKEAQTATAECWETKQTRSGCYTCCNDEAQAGFTKCYFMPWWTNCVQTYEQIYDSCLLLCDTNIRATQTTSSSSAIP